jgi:hypothetical protein
MRARVGFADGVTGRAHTFGECHALALELAWRAVFGGRQHRRRKGYDDCKCDRGQSFRHLRQPFTAVKKTSVRSTGLMEHCNINKTETPVTWRPPPWTRPLPN